MWHMRNRINVMVYSCILGIFFFLLLSIQVPNPLFDLAGITCGHCLVPFWTFFGATLIGKAIIKMHIQVLLLITKRSSHVLLSFT